MPDVVVTDDSSGPSATFHVYAFKGNGVRLFSTQPKNYFGTTSNAGDPIIANVFGTSAPEILVPTNTEVCVLSAAGVQLTDNGTHPVGHFSYYCDTTISSVAVDDLETPTDGVKIEVVAVSATPFPSATDTKVYVWNPIAPTAPPWAAPGSGAGRPRALTSAPA